MTWDSPGGTDFLGWSKPLTDESMTWLKAWVFAVRKVLFFVGLNKYPLDHINLHLLLLDERGLVLLAVLLGFRGSLLSVGDWLWVHTVLRVLFYRALWLINCPGRVFILAFLGKLERFHRISSGDAAWGVSADNVLSIVILDKHWMGFGMVFAFWKSFEDVLRVYSNVLQRLLSNWFNLTV